MNSAYFKTQTITSRSHDSDRKDRRNGFRTLAGKKRISNSNKKTRDTPGLRGLECEQRFVCAVQGFCVVTLRK